MNKAVVRVASRICDRCQVQRCDKDGCWVDLKGTPSVRLIVDMDCDALRMPDQQKRCDYLFVGEEHGKTYVVPIEFEEWKIQRQRSVGADRRRSQNGRLLAPARDFVEIRPPFLCMKGQSIARIFTGSSLERWSCVGKKERSNGSSAAIR